MRCLCGNRAADLLSWLTASCVLADRVASPILAPLTKRAATRQRARLTSDERVRYPPAQRSGRRVPVVLGWHLILATCISLPACNGPSRLIGPTELERLLTLPGQPVFQMVASPDGFLFAGGPGFLMRSQAGDHMKWELIAEPSEAIVQLYAPSRDVVYALTQNCNRVFRWDTSRGWHEPSTPVRDSSWRDADYIDCIHLYHIWGRSANDVYAVGTAATVLHFDGTRWQIVSTPFTSRPERFHVRFMGVTGNDSDVVVSGDRILRLRRGEWSEVNPPVAPTPCVSLVTAMSDGDALFAYNSCVMRLRGDTWAVLRPSIPGFRGSIYDARTQPEGTALFWSYEGDVAAVRDGTLRSYHFAALRLFGSAVAFGKHLYIAGLVGDNGVVARVPR